MSFPQISGVKPQKSPYGKISDYEVAIEADLEKLVKKFWTRSRGGI